MVQYLMGNYTRLTIRSGKRLPPRVCTAGSVTSGDGGHRYEQVYTNPDSFSTKKPVISSRLRGAIMGNFGNNKKVVQALIERDGTKCHYCEVELVFNYSGYVENGYSIDHVLAKAEGGTEDLDNLLLACRSCNSRKGRRDYAVYMMKQDTDRTLLFLMRDDL